MKGLLSICTRQEAFGVFDCFALSATPLCLVRYIFFGKRWFFMKYFKLVYASTWKIPHFMIWGWSGGAMVLGKLPVPGRPTIWITVGQGPTALAVGAGGGCLDIFTLIYPISPLSPSLWETARYRLKYCLKGPLNPKQPTNQHFMIGFLFMCTRLEAIGTS